VILLAVRWYAAVLAVLPDVPELRAERGLAVDHVTIYGAVALSQRAF
jgi:transposase-like protein